MSTPHPTHAPLSEVARDALAELVAQYARGSDGAARPVDRARPDPLALAASIGFVSERLRGSLVLIGNPASVAALMPFHAACGGSAKVPELADWLAELSNQLMCRVKNKIIRFGVVVEVSVPSVFRGARLAAAPLKISMPANKAAVQVTAELMGLEVWIDAVVNEDLVLAPNPSIAPPAAEGELLLF